MYHLIDLSTYMYCSVLFIDNWIPIQVLLIQIYEVVHELVKKLIMLKV